MFERLNTPQETFNFKLGAALKMERTVLEILDDAIESAQDEEVRELLQAHRGESEQHVANVEAAFSSLDWEVDDSPCPAIDGLGIESSANVKKADDSVMDSVILQGAVEIEHHEIGVYENLIVNATAAGWDEVAELLNANLESEQSALNKVVAAEAKNAVAAQPA